MVALSPERLFATGPDSPAATDTDHTDTGHTDTDHTDTGHTETGHARRTPEQTANGLSR